MKAKIQIPNVDHWGDDDNMGSVKDIIFLLDQRMKNIEHMLCADTEWLRAAQNQTDDLMSCVFEKVE